MRIGTALGLAAAGLLVAASTAEAAAPLRADAALPPAGPAATPLSTAAAARAGAPAADGSDLIGFPVLAFVGLFAGIAVVILAVSGGARSSG